MKIKEHVIFGLILSIIIFLILPKIGLLGFSLIFLSSFLVDVDHYFYYILKEKNWNLRKAYLWHVKKVEKWKKFSRKKRNKTYLGFFIFHGLEIPIILILFGIFIHFIFLYISLGYLFHLFLDLLVERKFKDRTDKLSIVHDFLKFKKLEFIRD